MSIGCFCSAIGQPLSPLRNVAIVERDTSKDLLMPSNTLLYTEGLYDKVFRRWCRLSVSTLTPAQERLCYRALKPHQSHNKQRRCRKELAIEILS